MLLFIDTTEFGIVNLGLIEKNNNPKIFTKELAFNENYKTLELIEKFLKREKANIKNVTKIIVCSGPGSFTGIRVGISIAQAFGFALEIPVTTIPKDKIPNDLSKLLTIKLPDKLILNYGQKPNITLSSKK